MEENSLIDEIEQPKLPAPEPPKVAKVTHHSLECNWKHVRDALPRNKRFKYLLQERRPKNINEWFTIYT